MTMERTLDGNCRQRQQSRLRSSIALSSVLVALGVLASACGGSASPGVADLGSTTTTANAVSAQAGSHAPGQQALAFTHCMRTHGVPGFPEPQISSHGVSINIGPGAGVNPKSAIFRSASQIWLREFPLQMAEA